MSPHDLAKCDATALLAGLTYMLRRLCNRRGVAMLDRIEMGECVALARWMDAFEPGPDPVVDRDFRTSNLYEISNVIRENQEKCPPKS